MIGCPCQVGGGGNFQKEMHRVVSRKGCAEQSKTPVVHDTGPGLRLGNSPLFWGSSPDGKQGQANTRLQPSVGTATPGESNGKCVSKGTLQSGIHVETQEKGRAGGRGAFISNARPCAHPLYQRCLRPSRAHNRCSVNTC